MQLRELRRWCVLGLVAMGATSVAHAQATGTIEGKVTDQATGRAMAGVQVGLVGAPLGALTNDAGMYRIPNVPARAWTVRVRLIGYAPVSRAVTVVAGQTARVDAEIAKSALELERVVVSGTGQAVEVRKLGNTVATVKPPENTLINSVADILTGREPGLVGSVGSGMTGEGTAIRIRGNASLSQSNEPIVFIDGIRMNSGGGLGSVGTGGGGQSSRLDDIDPSTIERLEVLKGAAAATLYGSEASNGVIQIFTKKGASGAPRWNLSLTQEGSRFPNTVAPNSGFARSDTAAARLSTHWGQTIRAYQPFETPVFMDNLTETGRASTAALQVQGGGDKIQYFASGRFQGENGPFGGTDLFPTSVGNAVEDQLRRTQTSLNVTLLPTSKLRIGVRNSFFNTYQQIPENNNNIYGTSSLSYMARPEIANCSASTLQETGTRPRCSGLGNPFGNQAFQGVREAMGQINESGITRYNGVLDGFYNLTSDWTANATFGYDITNQRDVGFSPFGYNVDGITGQTPTGQRTASELRTRVLTVDAKTNYNWQLTDRIKTAWTAGLQVFNTGINQTASSSQAFPGPGIELTSAGSDNIVATEGFSSVITGGYFGQMQAEWNDWIFATVGGRYDFASAFGRDAGGIFMPKVSMSIVPSDRKGWGFDKISTFRIRGAIGQAGRQPSAFDRFTTFGALAGEVGAGLVPNNLGNTALKPEISTEIEGGFEVGLFDDRIGLDFTYWDRSVKDALVPRQFPLSGGFRNTQVANIGQLDGNGMEIALRGQAIRRKNFSLDMFANAAYLKQIVTSLGGAPAIKVGYFRYRGFIKEGDPLGSLYTPLLASACPNGGTTPATNSAGRPIACFGPNQFPINFNGQGSAATREQLLAYLAQPRALKNSGVQAALQPLLADYQGTNNLLEQRNGKTIPDWTGSFGGSANVGQRWRINTNFEWRTGFVIQNLTDGFRNSQHPSIGSNKSGFTGVEAILENPASTPEQRLAAAETYVRQYRRLLEPGLSQNEVGDFLRLRELSLTYTASPNLAAKFRAKSLSATLAGRNLYVWTGYQGVDPEANAQSPFGAGTNTIDNNFLQATDAFGVAVPRRIAFTINYGF
jgi:TonB-dependent starch-binding outer membrane protein SusC